MSSSTLWCAAGGVWGGAAAFLAVALCRLEREVRALRRKLTDGE